MICKESKNVEAYVAGKLNAPDTQKLEQHLENCGQCKAYLKVLRKEESVLSDLRQFNPKLENPEVFRRAVMQQIPVDSVEENTNPMVFWIDRIVHVLVQPATRFAFITAAVLIFGIFIYQQSIIVQKMSSLEERMNTNTRIGDSKESLSKNLETFFRSSNETELEDDNSAAIRDRYQKLQLKHRYMLKILRQRYPDVYKEILKEVEGADAAPNNVDI